MIFIGLLLRLYSIQVYDNKNLKLASLRQRSREITLGSKRGPIFDRNLVPLTNDNVINILICRKEKLLLDEKLFDIVRKNTLLSRDELKE